MTTIVLPNHPRTLVTHLVDCRTGPLSHIPRVPPLAYCAPKPLTGRVDPHQDSPLKIEFLHSPLSVVVHQTVQQELEKIPLDQRIKSIIFTIEHGEKRCAIRKRNLSHENKEDLPQIVLDGRIVRFWNRVVERRPSQRTARVVISLQLTTSARHSYASSTESIIFLSR